MATKKTATKKAATTSPKPRKKRGLYGCLKGKIHYKDDSIFNLGL